MIAPAIAPATVQATATAGPQPGSVSTVRARILGLLLRDARLAVGRSQADLASFLGIDSAQIAAYEAGQAVPSLPEIEAWAYYVRVPLSRFWSTETVSNEPQPNVPRIREVRQRMIGLQLRQARIEANQSRYDCAQVLGLPAEQIDAYESGRVAVPVTHLERLAEFLGTTITAFITNDNSSIHRWLQSQLAFEQFSQLPDDLQAFILDPLNGSYLQVAKQLSRMPAQQLRHVAEGLLEITY